MYNLVIGIPTYKRPLMLRKLILSIFSLDINQDLIKSVTIALVDNDIERTGEPVAQELMTQCPSAFDFHYYSFPKKGLTNVRNEILDKALSFNPDYIAFVDDDEYVAKYWLNELMTTMVKNNADIVQGPNFSVFEKKPAHYLARWFKFENFENNEKLDFVETGNSMIRSKFLSDNNLKFDSRFNQTGGEDTYFGVQAIKNGAMIFWATNAAVYETIPRSRSTVQWLVKRWYRGATTYTYILKLEKEYSKLAKKIIVSFVYLAIGALGLVLLPFPVKHKYWGLFKICEGLGGFAGFFNIRYKEYH